MEYKKNSFLGIYGTANYGDRPLVSSGQRGDCASTRVIRELFHFIWLIVVRLWEPSVFFYFLALPIHNKYGLPPQGNERYSVWSPWWWEVRQLGNGTYYIVRTSY
jgi:hypothetical protein